MDVWERFKALSVDTWKKYQEWGEESRKAIEENQKDIEELDNKIYGDRAPLMRQFMEGFGPGGLAGVTKGGGGKIIDLALRKRLKAGNILDDLRAEAKELNRLMGLAKEFVNLNYMDWEDLARQHANVDIYTNILDDLTKQGLSENEQILRVGGRNVYDRIKALTKIKNESRSLLDDLMKQDEDLRRRWWEAYDKLHPPEKD